MLHRYGTNKTWTNTRRTDLRQMMTAIPHAAASSFQCPCQCIYWWLFSRSFSVGGGSAGQELVLRFVDSSKESILVMLCSLFVYGLYRYFPAIIICLIPARPRRVPPPTLSDRLLTTFLALQCFRLGHFWLLSDPTNHSFSIC